MFSSKTSVRHLEFKILNFGHRIFVIVLIYFSVQNLIESNGISLKSSDITIFKMVVVRHLGFPNFENFHIRPSLLLDYASSYKIS